MWWRKETPHSLPLPAVVLPLPGIANGGTQCCTHGCCCVQGGFICTRAQRQHTCPSCWVSRESHCRESHSSVSLCVVTKMLCPELSSKVTQCGLSVYHPKSPMPMEHSCLAPLFSACITTLAWHTHQPVFSFCLSMQARAC